MKILMVASECFPLIKTGGLADVVGALPRALTALGCDVRVMVPNYPAVAGGLRDPHPVAALGDLFGGPGAVLSGTSETGLSVLAVDAPHLFDRPGNPYLGPDGRDWPDNHLPVRRPLARRRAVRRGRPGWMVARRRPCP